MVVPLDEGMSVLLLFINSLIYFPSYHRSERNDTTFRIRLVQLYDPTNGKFNVLR